jgi:hypothetical protein
MLSASPIAPTGPYSVPRRSERLEVPGSRVPMEFVGKARVLRDSLIEPANKASAKIEILISPLRPRPRFLPMPKHRYLRHVADCWKKLPAFGRLGSVSEFADGRLRLAEIRAVPARMQLEGWESDELAIAVVMRFVRCAPPAYEAQHILVGDIGLHALARRVERGFDRTDRAVLADLTPLAHAYRAICRAGGDFKIRVEGGTWKGTVSLVKGKPCLTVRTFTD